MKEKAWVDEDGDELEVCVRYGALLVFARSGKEGASVFLTKEQAQELVAHLTELLESDRWNK